MNRSRGSSSVHSYLQHTYTFTHHSHSQTILSTLPHHIHPQLTSPSARLSYQAGSPSALLAHCQTAALRLPTCPHPSGPRLHTCHTWAEVKGMTTMSNTLTTYDGTYCTKVTLLLGWKTLYVTCICTLYFHAAPPTLPHPLLHRVSLQT